MLSAAQIRQLRSADLDGPNRLRLAMHLTGVTQAALAAGIGLTQGYVSLLVRGRTPGLQLEMARKLAVFFGCEIDDLFPPASRRSARPVAGARA